jgi:acetylornithine/succinyldiaminopimelate/putrescine aminotransferase
MRQLFLQHLAQTSPSPMGIEVERADGIYLYAPDGKRWIDLATGVSVSALGHGHPHVVEAVQRQAERYMHLMVYGEYVQTPQVRLAQRLTSLLPPQLGCIYLVNSGSEAVEGALKLAKRYTGRTEIIAFRNAYHGSTHGAMSLMSNEEYKRPFRPLLPDVRFLTFNNICDLQHITTRTACVIAEPVQAEAGVVVPKDDFLQHLRRRCTDTGTLLIFDEVQTGMGRTGAMFAFEKYGATPDILTLAKAFGGGMPLGAFVASHKIMDTLTRNPALGHISTFGGHPVSCAAALAALEVLIDEHLIEQVSAKSAKIKQLLNKCPAIKEVRGEGLLLAAELADADAVQRFLHKGLEYGIATDGFLYCPNAFRIAPPLIITDKQIEEVCRIIGKCACE